jgi:chemotaxis protein MotB
MAFRVETVRFGAGFDQPSWSFPRWISEGLMFVSHAAGIPEAAMAGKSGKKDSRGGVIIKRYETAEEAHHGGAWKVAYADFVTAMMAFFLLMWLLNATTEDQRKGLADYFSPNSLLSHASSGTGDPFGGHTAFDEGALVSDRGAVQAVVGRAPVPDQTEEGKDPVTASFHRARDGDGVGQGPMVEDQDADDEVTQPSLGEAGTRRAPGPGGPADTRTQGQAKLSRDAAMTDSGADQQLSAQARAEAAAAERALRVEQARQEKASLQQAAEQIRQAVQADPALADLSKQLAIDMTPDGLRIQIMDEIKLPMFPSGSATPNERVRLLMQKVVPVLQRLTQPISIAGHTDAQPYPGPDRTNWELSAERANATRRLLTDGGFPDTRIKSVIGDADRDPLLPADPMAAANRRIAILVLREAPSPVSARQAPISPSAIAPKPSQRGPSQSGLSQPNRSQPSSSQSSPSPSVASTN